MIEEVCIHTPDGGFEVKKLIHIPGTVIRRKRDLPFNVHPHFPVGETKVVTEPCGRINHLQDPDREFAHVWVNADPTRGIAVGYCFHPYADTLEVVDGDTDTHS